MFTRRYNAHEKNGEIFTRQWRIKCVSYAEYYLLKKKKITVKYVKNSRKYLNISASIFLFYELDKLAWQCKNL